jgi:hypothetical protein
MNNVWEVKGDGKFLGTVCAEDADSAAQEACAKYADYKPDHIAVALYVPIGEPAAWKTTHAAVCVPLTEDKEIADQWKANGYTVMEFFARPKSTMPLREAREATAAIETLSQRVREPKRDAARNEVKSAELTRMMSNIIHDQTVAMQAALIEWRHGKGADAALQWIVNTLRGPGHLPDFDAEHGKNAQFWFDSNCAEPSPKCFCGNPSHIVWMGQGFCCDAHYEEGKSKFDAKQPDSRGTQ